MITENTKFTFIDLFSGIGDMRLASEYQNGKCVFSCEINKYAIKTNIENFGNSCKFETDIRSCNIQEIPDHDLLLAGFPCQPFSISGVSIRSILNRPHGFDYPDQGNLFFEIAKIIKIKKPKAFILENVKNLIYHNKGNTFQIILDVLTNELGYNVYWKVLNSKFFVPQNRERVFIIGFREHKNFTWDDLYIPNETHTLKEILHKTDGTEPVIMHDGSKYFDHSTNKVRDKYTLSERCWKYHQDKKERYKKIKRTGFTYTLVTPNDIARILVANYNYEIFVYQGENIPPRRLTPRECARLMGFPDSFIISVSTTQAYRQFGNSVVVPLVSEIVKLVKHHIISEK